MNIKIQGGTARHGDPSLCLTCRHGQVVHGARATDRLVACAKLETRVTFQVTSCSEYVDSQHPSLYHMEDIAWVLRTDAKRRRIGFVRGKDLKWKDRLNIDED